MVIGYFRNLLRAGKPEFVGLALMRVNVAELFPNPAQVDRGIKREEHRIASVQDLSALVDDILNDQSKRQKLSIPLWVNLVAIKDLIAFSSQRVADLLRIPVKT